MSCFGLFRRLHFQIKDLAAGQPAANDLSLTWVREDVLSVLEPGEREVFLGALGRLACGRLAEPAVCAHTVRRPR